MKKIAPAPRPAGRETIARDLADRYTGRLEPRQLRQALNEADALAALTPFPALFLPALAEEKVRAAATWSDRQQRLRRSDRAFALAA